MKKGKYFELNNEFACKITGFEDYAVSETGKVYNMKYGKELAPALAGNKQYQFLSVILRKGNKSTSKYVHRLVAEAFVANPELKKYVNFIDTESNDYSARNLFWTNTKKKNKKKLTNE